MKICWQVEMESCHGHTCYATLSCDDAPFEEQALANAALMFPELTVVSAHHIYASDNVEPNRLSA